METDIQDQAENPKTKIIVAEDDSFFRAFICDLLRSHGYDVVAFSGGDAAFEAANKLHAEILITDLIMDEGEGISTIMKTRQIQKHMKILAVSSSAKYLNYAMRMGADCAMQKPIRSQELLENISRLQCTDKNPTSENNDREAIDICPI